MTTIDPNRSAAIRRDSRRSIAARAAAVVFAALMLIAAVSRGNPCESPQTSVPGAARSDTTFETRIQPWLKQHCVRCHDADTMESGVRVDQLTAVVEDRQLRLWDGIRKQLDDEAMPPEGEPQPSAESRREVVAWIDQAVKTARSRKRDKNGSVRRLTVSQYRHTLRDLLGLEDDLAVRLPPEAVSKDGFLNNQQSMLLSPLLLEAYLDVADEALDRCLVDPGAKPSIQNFRMDLGTGINPEPCPDVLVLGALSHLLPNPDFVVTQLTPDKPFDYEPFFMRTNYRFIEGYQGNDTVRGWREFDSIYHAVFACLRGTDGYPQGRAYQTVPEGLLLRPAIPSSEVFEVESTYGPRANFKISLRELPDFGRFRVTVKAARYDDGLLLDETDLPADAAAAGALVLEGLDDARTIDVPQAGIYQIDVSPPPAADAAKSPQLVLWLGERHFSGSLSRPAFLAVRLAAGPLEISARLGDAAPQRIVLTPLSPTDELAARFARFEKRTPRLGVHLGLRRDCGSTLTRVGDPQTVDSNALAEYVFEGAIRNFPSPDVEKDNVNYLAGIREIGVRSEFTDGRDMPRLLIRSVEFEGPFYETWPPESHRNIFIESRHAEESADYAREVIDSLARRAYRGPLAEEELAALVAVWETSFSEGRSFRESIRDALLVVLTSPRFLFLIENSATPDAEPLDGWELASKLSYFLWDSPPDAQLLRLAETHELHAALDAEIDRMVADPRCERFVSEFASQWLSLDKLDVVEIDRKRFPRLTRDVKAQLRREPAELLLYLLRENLPARHLVHSEFVLANEVVADYYGLAERTESGFDFVPIPHGTDHLGGLLSQAGPLAGLSDGRESNPVKRGAWLARKIIADPPDDPPPNVPALPEEGVEPLSLRERLERHRDQKGCAKCHAGIDSWGIPFEQFDAAGRFKTGADVDARSQLPDRFEVADLNGLKSYLADERPDRVVFSLLKHLTIYAIGRDLNENEIESLRRQSLELADGEPRLRDLLHRVVRSPMFLEK